MPVIVNRASKYDMGVAYSTIIELRYLLYSWPHLYQAGSLCSYLLEQNTNTNFYAAAK